MATRQTQGQRQRGAARRTELGALLPLLDAELAAEAVVTPADQPATEAFVEATAGQRGVELLRAEPDRPG